MRKHVLRFALLAAIGAAGCGDDDPVSTGDELTESELEGLALALVGGANLGVPAPSAPAAGGPVGAPVAYSASISTTLECTGGGTIAVTGSAAVTGDDETNQYSVSYNVTEQHQACREYGPDEGEFTLDSSLSYSFSLDFDLTEQMQTIAGGGTTQGTVDWTSGDRSGSCSASLTFEADVSEVSGSTSVSGSLCGSAVSVEFIFG